MKIYLVMCRTYDSCHVVSAWNTEEAAKKLAQDVGKGGDVITCEMGTDTQPVGDYVFYISEDDFLPLRIMYEDNYACTANRYFNEIYYSAHGNSYSVTVRAPNHVQAFKLGRDLIDEFKARGGKPNLDE